MEARSVEAWRAWLGALANDADAAQAAALAYEQLDASGRDAWIESLAQDALELGVPRIAVYAPLLAVELDNARRQRIQVALGPIESIATPRQPTRALVGVAATELSGLRRTDIPALRRNDIPALRRGDIPALRRSDITALRRNDIPALRRSDITALRHGDIGGNDRNGNDRNGGDPNGSDRNGSDRNDFGRNDVPGSDLKVAVLISPLYMDFVQVMACGYRVGDSFDWVRHDPIVSARSAIRPGDKVGGVVVEASPLKGIIDELALTIVAHNRARRPLPPTLRAFAHVFGPAFGS